MAFTILIGPFLVLGSFLALAKDKPSLQLKFNGSWAAIVAACVAYLLLGAYGAAIDTYATRECNDWRRLIVYLSRGKSNIEDIIKEKLNEKNDEFVKKIITEEPFVTKLFAYFAGLGLVLIIFLCVAYLLFC
jgi:hypothetical protein